MVLQFAETGQEEEELPEASQERLGPQRSLSHHGQSRGLSASTTNANLTIRLPEPTRPRKTTVFLQGQLADSSDLFLDLSYQPRALRRRTLFRVMFEFVGVQCIRVASFPHRVTPIFSVIFINNREKRKKGNGLGTVCNFISEND